MANAGKISDLFSASYSDGKKYCAMSCGPDTFMDLIVLYYHDISNKMLYWKKGR